MSECNSNVFSNTTFSLESWQLRYSVLISPYIKFHIGVSPILFPNTGEQKKSRYPSWVSLNNSQNTKLEIYLPMLTRIKTLALDTQRNTKNCLVGTLKFLGREKHRLSASKELEVLKYLLSFDSFLNFVISLCPYAGLCIFILLSLPVVQTMDLFWTCCQFASHSPFQSYPFNPLMHNMGKRVFIFYILA